MTSRLRLLAYLLIAAGFLAVASPVQAEPLALKLTPLQYQETVPLGKVKVGFVDVSNPTTKTLTLRTDVQAFRQIDNDGNLAFYPDESLRAGITTDVSEFQLGPREAIRVVFRIDPNKLHRGGVYGALFFNTVVPKSAGSGNQVTAAARVGSLLILNIGQGGTVDGRVGKFHLPFISLGNGIHGGFEYENTAAGLQPVAFNPKLQLKAGFIGKFSDIRGPLVLPDSTRTIQVEKKGSFIGFIPVQVKDLTNTVSHTKTTYVWALTGYWRLVVLLFFVIFITCVFWLRKRKK